MRGVIKALCSVTSISDMEKLLKELLTENEQEALDLRWELMRQLKEGKTQRQIAGDLHISLCKVTRGNKILKDKNSISNSLLDEECKNG